MKGIKDTQATIQNVNIKIDPVVKGAAEGVLSGMGLNMSAYIGMCLRQVAQDRKIPFTQTVDPDFWVTEAKVGTAKAYIDSGAFTSAFETYEKMFNAIWKGNEEALVKAFKEGKGGAPNYILVQVAEVENKADIGSPSKILLTLKGLPSSVRHIGDILQATNDDGESVDAGRRFCDTYANAVESLGTSIEGIVSSAFDSESCLRDVLDRAPSDLTVEEKADALDSVISTVLDVASDNPSNLSMRFVGAGGQATLESVFDALAAVKEYREWLADADKRVNETRSHAEHLEDRVNQQWLDLIRANNGVPSTQNITQVMPKPERDLSPEEMIERAETFKKIMGILGDEDED